MDTIELDDSSRRDSSDSARLLPKRSSTVYAMRPKAPYDPVRLQSKDDYGASSFAHLPDRLILLSSFAVPPTPASVKEIIEVLPQVSRASPAYLRSRVIIGRGFPGRSSIALRLTGVSRQNEALLRTLYSSEWRRKSSNSISGRR